jgi:hypothetical protein
MNLKNSQFKLAALGSTESAQALRQKRHSFGPELDHQVRSSIAIQSVPSDRNLICNGERRGHSSVENQSLWHPQMIKNPNGRSDFRSEITL